MSENLRNFTKAVYGMDAVVNRVADDQWDKASPCEGWSARDVVAHQAGVLQGLAAMARSGSIVMPEMPDDRSDPMSLWASARDEVLEALDHRGVLQQEGQFWFGPMSIDDLVGAVQWDPLVHAWDVAQACGLDAHTDQEVASRSLAAMGPMADALRGMNLIGDPIEVPADADPMSQFLGLVGRNPAGG